MNRSQPRSGQYVLSRKASPTFVQDSGCSVPTAAGLSHCGAEKSSLVGDGLPRLSALARIAGLLLLALLQTSCFLGRGGSPLISDVSCRAQGEQASGVCHTVEAGDTLAAIAKTYEVDLRHLAEVNKLKKPYEIEAGSKIFVPNASVMKRTTAAEMPQPRPTDVSRTLGWPVEGKIVSRFRAKPGPQYKGIGIGADEGTPVRAAADGKVGHVGSIGGLGNLVLIQHADRLVTVYAHLKEIKVREGQSVSKGAVIGAVGTSGRIDTPCLYFEVRSRSNPKNPLLFLESRG